MGQHDPNYPLAKMFVTFAYLLCPIILPKISKQSLEWIMILKVAKILANVVPNYPFAPKQNFLWKLTNITFAYLLSSIIQQCLKQIFRADHYIQGCIILAQIGSKLPIFPKRFFSENWLLLLSTYCVVSYYNTSKKIS